jgi:hypothetical protein
MLALAGWAYDLADPAVALLAQGALQGWVGHGLPYRTSDAGARLFDPVEVWTVMKRLGRGGQDSYFRDRYAATGRRLVTDLAPSDGPFSLEMRRTFDLSDAEPGRSLRLRLPLPLDQRHAHRSVEVIGEGIDPSKVTVEANRLELRCVPSGPSLTLAARIGFSAPSDRAVDEDRDIYLRQCEGTVVVSERVHDLARSLAVQGATVRQSVRAFWTYMIERFACVPIHYDQVDPAAPCDWVIDAGVYDCRLGAVLFVALCRARGIAARLVGGHVLYRRAPTNHYWAEYWCGEGGWTPVDFLGWDLSCGGEEPAWRDHFFGRVDARLVTEQLPLAFTGAPGVTIPPQWHLLQSAAGDGVEIALTALDGRPVYTDRIRLLD